MQQISDKGIFFHFPFAMLIDMFQIECNINMVNWLYICIFNFTLYIAFSTKLFFLLLNPAFRPP